MDNQKLILAVAGSGKTYYLVQQFDRQRRFLVFTYTISGTENLISEVITRFGHMPGNIKIYNFFSFLYSFCYRPFLADDIDDKGIYWKFPTDIYNQSYLTKSKYLYYNRMSKLVHDQVMAEVRNRIDRYFDMVMVDEVQDFAGHDFNFLLQVSQAKAKSLLVGDFYQHTFDTSRDRRVNATLHDDYKKYIKRFKDVGFSMDGTTLVKSRRCSKTTCDFIKQRLGIDIDAANSLETKCELVTNKKRIEEIFKDDTIVKLFLKEHYKFKCRSDNWGACKGLTFQHVCVVISGEILKNFKHDRLFEFKAQSTKNKFYVACSRPLGDLYFIHDKPVKELSEAIT